jgi:hypothetical protein
MKPFCGAALALALVLAPSPDAQGAKKQAASLPEPKLRFVGTEPYEANGFDFIRYKYEVTNRDKFKKELFAASPDLPACNENPNASRTWIDLYDGKGKKLYWFCALTDPDDLKNLWFAITGGASPPGEVYIEMTDRRTGAHIRSNFASTPK